MKRSESLLNLISIVETYNELNKTLFPCALKHYADCVEDTADEVIGSLQNLLAKSEIGTCRIPLTIDFEKGTDINFWFGCKILNDIPKERSTVLMEKFDLLTDLLLELQMKRKQVDPKRAEQFIKRMSARVKKNKRLPYEIWRADPNNMTIEKIWTQEVQLTFKLGNMGILDFDDAPSGEEIDGVDLDLLAKGLKAGTKIPEGFENTAAIIRRYSFWQGKMFMINYPLIYIKLYEHCFDKFTPEQRKALIDYDRQLRMMHADMAMIDPEYAKYLDTNDDSDIFGIMNALTRMCQQQWFKDRRTDKMYDDAWIESFFSALLHSEHRATLLNLWQDADKRHRLKGNIIGCLKKAGVIKGPDKTMARDFLISSGDSENTTFGIYIGEGKNKGVCIRKDTFDKAICNWICDYVNH